MDAYMELRPTLHTSRTALLRFWIGQLDVWNELAEEALRSLSRICVSAGTERVFSRLKWLEGLRRLRLTDEHLRSMTILTVNIGVTRGAVMDVEFRNQWLLGDEPAVE